MTDPAQTYSYDIAIRRADGSEIVHRAADNASAADLANILQLASSILALDYHAGLTRRGHVDDPGDT